MDVRLRMADTVGKRRADGVAVLGNVKGSQTAHQVKVREMSWVSDNFGIELDNSSKIDVNIGRRGERVGLAVKHFSQCRFL